MGNSSYCATAEKMTTEKNAKTMVTSVDEIDEPGPVAASRLTEIKTQLKSTYFCNDN